MDKKHTKCHDVIKQKVVKLGVHFPANNAWRVVSRALLGGFTPIVPVAFSTRQQQRAGAGGVFIPLHKSSLRIKSNS